LKWNYSIFLGGEQTTTIMSDNITRRRFISQSAKAGIALSGTAILPGINSCGLFKQPADISVVHGDDHYGNTIKAVEMIGGLKKMVPAGSEVGLLINSDFDVFGAYVNPDISIAAVNMLWEAGAGNITCLQVVKDEYWQRSKHFDEYKEMISSLKQVQSNFFPSEFNDNDFVRIKEFPGGKALPETEVVKKWLDCDVFVNIAISKHHMTTFYTGLLKNIMGVSTRKANVFFHLGSGTKNDPDFLAQCIVDQNLLKKSNLCIVDSTAFIIDNGPSGPGTIETQSKIVAGTDMVAVDALCSTFLGYQADEILTTLKASQAGLGQIDFTKLSVEEIYV
jgi:uncharacterized protein (DUF362 family)